MVPKTAGAARLVGTPWDYATCLLLALWWPRPEVFRLHWPRLGRMYVPPGGGSMRPAAPYRNPSNCGPGCPHGPSSGSPPRVPTCFFKRGPGEEPLQALLQLLFCPRAPPLYCGFREVALEPLQPRPRGLKGLWGTCGGCADPLAPQPPPPPPRSDPTSGRTGPVSPPRSRTLRQTVKC